MASLLSAVVVAGAYENTLVLSEIVGVDRAVSLVSTPGASGVISLPRLVLVGTASDVSVL